MGCVSLLRVVPGIAPEQHIAERVSPYGRPEHRREPIVEGQLLASGIGKGDELLVCLAESGELVEFLLHICGIFGLVVVEIVDAVAEQVYIVVAWIPAPAGGGAEVGTVGPYQVVEPVAAGEYVVRVAVELLKLIGCAALGALPEPVAAHFVPRPEDDGDELTVAVAQCAHKLSHPSQPCIERVTQAAASYDVADGLA